MKNLTCIIFFLFFYANLAFSFETGSSGKDVGTGGREDLSYLKAKNSNFKKGRDALKQGLKLKKKNKIQKADKKFEKALKYFVIAYNNFPGNIDIINNLGFTYNEIGDLMMSEIYYQEALLIEPKNPLINIKLAELYLNTKRINLARDRLEVLKSCNCQEYLNLKNILEKK
tara:strand:- start:205 stop:717 length:513 start_codon:yes stop_codon:yes gene_type:complete